MAASARRERVDTRAHSTQSTAPTPDTRTAGVLLAHVCEVFRADENAASVEALEMPFACDAIDPIGVAIVLDELHPNDQGAFKLIVAFPSDRANAAHF